MEDTGDITLNVLKKASEGDHSAFRVIYYKIAGTMYSLCMRYTADDADANDLLQNGFIRLYKNLSQFRNEGSFEGWARRVFVSTCLDYVKKRKIVFSEMKNDPPSEPGYLNGFDKLSFDDMIKMIRLLPDGYRTVFNLYFIEGYSHREISRMLGIDYATSKSQLSRAKSRLRQMMVETNG